MTNEEMIREYRRGNNDMKGKLIESNLNLVISLANKFDVSKTVSFEKEDLVQEGCIGLMVAIEKYDPDHTSAAKFSTYAIHWIRQKISRYIRTYHTNDESSLNIKVGEDESGEMIEFIKDDLDNYSEIENKIYNGQLRIELEKLMNEYLPLKEREILKLRYGWNLDPMKYDDLANLFTVSKQHIQDNEARALARLRRTRWFGERKREYNHFKEVQAKRIRYNNINALMNYMFSINDK